MVSLARRSLAPLGAVAVIVCTARCSLLVTTDGLAGGEVDGGPGVALDGAAASDTGPACDGGSLSDPRHCGACGHDCLQGACTNGQCQPFTLTSNAGVVGYVAMDADHVYWTTWASDGGVYRAPRDGGAATRITGVEVGTFSLALLEGDAFYTTNRDIRRIPKGGGAASILSAQDAVDVVAEPGSLYFSVYGTADGGGSLGVLPLGSAKPSPVVLAAGLAGAEGVAVDGNGLFVAQTFRDSFPKVSKSGGVIASLPGKARRLALDDTFVYFVRFDSPSVHRARREGPTTEDIVATGTSNVEVGTLVLDGDDVLWAAGGAPSGVRRAPKRGGAVTELAAATRAVGIVSDGKVICWSDRAPSGGEIRCLAK